VRYSGLPISRDIIVPVLAVLLFVIGLVAVSGVLFVVGAFVFGRGEELAPAPRESPPVVLPQDRPPDSADIEALRLSVVLRGYRMLEVDSVLDQLAEALRDKDLQIVALTNQLSQQPAGDPLVGADSRMPTASDKSTESTVAAESTEAAEVGRRDA
jgi:DivIVA domain-containing protein